MTATHTASPFMKRPEVAALFRVDPSTVDRWARSGVLGDAVIRTPGGQYRYKRAELERFAAENGWSDPT